ncbi:hypothetical protein C8R47DRAFT_1070551 [Mycena vitilis]|nr:hypothetical protein C8R47DRAFT_1070551 [Mycena vitilis]
MRIYLKKMEELWSKMAPGDSVPTKSTELLDMGRRELRARVLPAGAESWEYISAPVRFHLTRDFFDVEEIYISDIAASKKQKIQILNPRLEGTKDNLSRPNKSPNKSSEKKKKTKPGREFVSTQRRTGTQVGRKRKGQQSCPKKLSCGGRFRHGDITEGWCGKGEDGEDLLGRGEAGVGCAEGGEDLEEEGPRLGIRKKERRIGRPHGGRSARRDLRQRVSIRRQRQQRQKIETLAAATEGGIVREGDLNDLAETGMLTEPAAEAGGGGTSLAVAGPVGSTSTTFRLRGQVSNRRRCGHDQEEEDQDISKNTALESSSRPCGSGGNSYISSEREDEEAGLADDEQHPSRQLASATYSIVVAWRKRSWKRGGTRELEHVIRRGKGHTLGKVKAC